MKYVNSYLSKQCSVDLQKLFSQSKKPLKEISESYGAYKHLAPYLENSSNVVNLFIGDGSLCMTGILFSFLTKNWSISIDPLINTNKVDKFREEIKLKHFTYDKSLFYTALDAQEAGFSTYYIEDATRPIQQEAFEAAKKSLQKEGVRIIQSDTIF